MKIERKIEEVSLFHILLLFFFLYIIFIYFSSFAYAGIFILAA